MKLTRLEEKANWFNWVLAFTICILLFGWFSYVVRFGMGRVDEAFYLTVPQRLLQGDRLLVEEWNLTQLTGLFQVLPFAIFKKITGGTDGIVLFMRYVYLGISFCVYWYIIVKLHENMWKAIVSAVLFCGFVPFSIFSANYYSLPLFIVLIVCFSFTCKKTRFVSFKVFFSGCLFSCAVIMTPGLAILFFLYCLLVGIYYGFRKKRIDVLKGFDFILNIRIWIAFFSGIVFSAFVFLFLINYKSGLRNVFHNIPNLLSDSEYNVSISGNVFTFILKKIKTAFIQFKVWNILICSILLALTISYNKAKNKKAFPFYFRTVLFLLIVLSFILLTVGAVSSKFKKINGWYYWFYHSDLYFPLFYFTCASCFLLEKVDKKNSLFLLIALGLSFFKDIFSDVSLGIGFALSIFPFVNVFPQLLKEIGDDLTHIPVKKHFVSKKKQLKMLQLFGIAKTAFLIFVSVWSVFNILSQHPYGFCEYDTNTIEHVINVPIESGPYKGIYTKPLIKNAYDKMIIDMDKIGEITNGTMYVSDLMPVCYLYLDRGCPAYSSWFVQEDISTRQIVYWEQFPKKKPDVIYIPNYNFTYAIDAHSQVSFERIEQLMDYECIEGVGGKIIIVNKWRL